MNSFKTNLLTKFLAESKMRYTENHPLNKLTTYRVGGPARFFIQPNSFLQAEKLQAVLLENEIPFFLLGGGSNILISDQGFLGTVIQFDFGEKPYLRKENGLNRVEIPASARTGFLSKYLAKQSLTGMEYISTIPGHLGGAIVQNAGCYGYEIKDSLQEAIVVENGSITTYSNQECGFTYRDSIFKKKENLWILQGNFVLQEGNPEAIARKMDEFKQKRLLTQPKNRRSAGSVFKNPKGQKAWQLISNAGLRGKKIGGAMVSEKHCNFIVNDGSATAMDIYRLAELVR
ncbi:MAG: UDP-N-acetylmuramate dehydrogenase, partial [Candidatus Hydrogenedentota bacterium]